MNQIAYKKYLLSLLQVILAFNFVDRVALGIVLQNIKVELSLSDTQLGVLSGLAFGVFFALMSLPIARWADRGNRVTIISLTATVWSVAVALCGVAGNFVQLLLIRAGVGIGEAGCIPPAHSLIADYFPRAERPRAVARYMVGVPAGLAIGYLAGGWLNQHYGWRATFIILGLPGLVLAALAWLTLREPRRVMAGAPARHVAPNPSFAETASTFWSNRAFRHLAIGYVIWAFCSYGIVQWMPTFFVRVHAMRTAELGVWLALFTGVGGCVGVYAGGELAARIAAGNERLQLIGCSLAFVFFSLINIGAYLVPNRNAALAGMLLASIGGNLVQGPFFATVQTLIPDRMRAVSIATMYLFANLIGMGFGPVLAGALSDALRARWGHDALSAVLAIFSGGYLWASWHMWRASRTVAADLAATHTINEGLPASTTLQSELPA